MMIKKFVDRFMAQQDQLLAKFKQDHPEDYAAIVRVVVETICGEDGYDEPDAGRITMIDHGDYQGTLLFVIAAAGYTPSDYWYVMVDYGSCSGCDTLEAISSCSNEPPTDAQAKDYMTLALHIVQGMKKMGDDQ